MRKVTIVSTKFSGNKEVMSDASNWGELKAHIESAGISLANMKAVRRDTSNTLESNNAELPTGDFVLFLTPAKVKSGK